MARQSAYRATAPRGRGCRHRAVRRDDRRGGAGVRDSTHYQQACRHARRTRVLKKAGDVRAFEREGERMVRSFEDACAEHVDEPVVWLSYSQMLAQSLGDVKASRRALQRGAAVSAHDREKSGLFVQLLALRELKENRVQSAYRLALIAAEMNEDCAALLRWQVFRDATDERAVFLASRVPP